MIWVSPSHQRSRNALFPSYLQTRKVSVDLSFLVSETTNTSQSYKYDRPIAIWDWKNSSLRLDDAQSHRLREEQDPGGLCHSYSQW